jgi:fermentation-respiration switch protein FrsA (DUF1100 family)
MAHGLSGVKEMDLDKFARRFRDAGFVVLLFDYRTFGASDGEPRGLLAPMMQTEDYRNALTWLQRQPEVDAARLAVWGTSLSGAHVLHVAAFDKRVKCVVSQVPTVDIYANLRHLQPPQAVQAWLAAGAHARRHLMETGEHLRMPVIAPPGELALINEAGTIEELAEQETRTPTWRNSISMLSIDYLTEYNPGANVELISPAPLLMIVAGADVLTPPDLALKVYARALEPKSLLFVPDFAHHEVYHSETFFEQAVSAAVARFTQSLMSPETTR